MYYVPNPNLKYGETLHSSGDTYEVINHAGRVVKTGEALTLEQFIDRYEKAKTANKDWYESYKQKLDQIHSLKLTIKELQHMINRSEIQDVRRRDAMNQRFEEKLDKECSAIRKDWYNERAVNEKMIADLKEINVWRVNAYEEIIKKARAEHKEQIDKVFAQWYAERAELQKKINELTCKNNKRITQFDDYFIECDNINLVYDDRNDLKINMKNVSTIPDSNQIQKAKTIIVNRQVIFLGCLYSCTMLSPTELEYCGTYETFQGILK